MTEYDISPNGKLSAFVIRGEIFITENNDKKKTVKISDSPYRDRDVKWVNDTTLIFVSDREGQYDLYCAFSSDKGETSLFRSLKITSIRLTSTDEDERNPVVSPDGKKVVYRRGNGKLIVADIAADHKTGNEKVLLDGWAAPEGMAWSPDSRWLAYSLSDLYENEEVFIQPADNSKEPVNVSMHPKNDVNPCWSHDGTKLGFISYRNNGNADAWFAWLKKSDWEKTKQEWDETEETPSTTKNDKSEKNDKKEETKPLIIDTDRIHERLQQVTALPGNESDLCISHDGNTFYFVTNRNSRFTFKAEMDLFSVKWDGTEMKPLTKGDQKPYAVTLNPGGTDLYMLKTGGTLFKLPVKSDKMEPIAFSAKMKIDYEKEKDQIFEEAWRSLDQNFYDPGFHGKDWKELRKKYKPWAMKASTYFDFRDIVNCMLGELNASHMALGGGQGRYVIQNEKSGLPGIDIEPLEKGVRVTHVIRNSPADKSASKINAGDVILSVNGVEIDNNVDFWSLLTNETEGRVLFEVKDPEGSIREVALRPAENLRQELYEEWVEERKQLVDTYSGGRLGYIHIEGMSWPSFERFERELTASGNGKEGIVIDVRYNGGGWTTDYLMAILNVQQHAYCIPRGAAGNLQKEHLRFRENYPFGERLPYFVWNKPSIALCNENSYSNAEIFSHAYKSLGIGKLVGMPTFGAVISTGANTLLDGSYIRLPFRAWYVSKTDQNMELNPAVPDIVLENPPDYKAKGDDTQLKAAVDELLRDIDSNKKQR